MEHIIENAIDNWLESIAPQLYISSVVFGAALIITGLLLIFAGKRSKEKRRRSNAGWICVLIGIVAIVSGLIQL